MRLFVGLDVSLEKTAICMISEHGKIVKEAQAASESEALLRWLCRQDSDEDHEADASCRDDTEPISASEKLSGARHNNRCLRQHHGRKAGVRCSILKGLLCG